MLKSIARVGLLVAVLVMMVVQSAAIASNSQSHHKAKARFFGPSAMKGWAQYEEKHKNGQLTQRLRVKINHAAPHQTLAVYVNGDVVGTLKTNSGGSGKLDLRSDRHHHSLPDGFASLDTGDCVSLGSECGVFFDPGNHHTQDFSVQGEDLTNGVQTQVSYSEQYDDGSLERQFQVEIDGATPGDSLDVTVNGEVVGTIVVDSQGQGQLELRSAPFINGDDEQQNVQPMPDTFPSLMAGDTVGVGSASVTLASNGGDNGDDNNEGDNNNGDDNGGGGDD